MIDFALARRKMVDNQLRTSGITDHRLLAAMAEVPRERFVSGTRHSLAYTDEVQPLGGTRRMAAPAAFARLVQLAAVSHADRVLDIGCGTGYSTAVLAKLAAEVVGFEDGSDLASRARANLADLGVTNATITSGPLSSAGQGGEQFDVILVEGALGAVSPDIVALLKDGGRLVAAVSAPGRPAVANLYVKSPAGLAASPAFDSNIPPLAPTPPPAFAL